MGVGDSILSILNLWAVNNQTMPTREKDVLKTRCGLAMLDLSEYRNSRSPRLGVMLRICDIKTYSKTHFRKSSINHSIFVVYGQVLESEMHPKTANGSQILRIVVEHLVPLCARHPKSQSNMRRQMD